MNFEKYLINCSKCEMRFFGLYYWDDWRYYGYANGDSWSRAYNYAYNGADGKTLLKTSIGDYFHSEERRTEASWSDKTWYGKVEKRHYHLRLILNRKLESKYLNYFNVNTNEKPKCNRAKTVNYKLKNLIEYLHHPLIIEYRDKEYNEGYKKFNLYV